MNCYFYDTHFFDSIDNSIKEALTYNQFKNGIKQRLTNSINCLKNELDKLKEKKLKEIDDYFEEIDKYLLDLKNKYLNVKQCLEDYYKVNQKFGTKYYFSSNVSKSCTVEKKTYYRTLEEVK